MTRVISEFAATASANVIFRFPPLPVDGCTEAPSSACADARSKPDGRRSSSVYPATIAWVVVSVKLAESDDRPTTALASVKVGEGSPNALGVIVTATGNSSEFCAALDTVMSYPLPSTIETLSTTAVTTPTAGFVNEEDPSSVLGTIWKMYGPERAARGLPSPFRVTVSSWALPVTETPPSKGRDSGSRRLPCGKVKFVSRDSWIAPSDGKAASPSVKFSRNTKLAAKRRRRKLRRSREPLRLIARRDLLPHSTVHVVGGKGSQQGRGRGDTAGVDHPVERDLNRTGRIDCGTVPVPGDVDERPHARNAEGSDAAASADQRPGRARRGPHPVPRIQFHLDEAVREKRHLVHKAHCVDCVGEARGRVRGARVEILGQQGRTHGDRGQLRVHVILRRRFVDHEPVGGHRLQQRKRRRCSCSVGHHKLPEQGNVHGASRRGVVVALTAHVRPRDVDRRRRA
eukprot:scaffold1070_cov245-Pinguiococcus_pyrenoidosus.AAC.7